MTVGLSVDETVGATGIVNDVVDELALHSAVPAVPGFGFAAAEVTAAIVTVTVTVTVTETETETVNADVGSGLHLAALCFGCACLYAWLHALVVVRSVAVQS